MPSISAAKLVATLWGVVLAFFVNPTSIPMGKLRGGEIQWLVLALVCIWLGEPMSRFLRRTLWEPSYDDHPQYVFLGYLGWLLLVGLTLFVLIMH